MFPAMDSASKAPVRRLWACVGLGLWLGGTGSGCASGPPLLQQPGEPVLGRLSPNHIYPSPQPDDRSWLARLSPRRLPFLHNRLARTAPAPIPGATDGPRPAAAAAEIGPGPAVDPPATTAAQPAPGAVHPGRTEPGSRPVEVSLQPPRPVPANPHDAGLSPSSNTDPIAGPARPAGLARTEPAPRASLSPQRTQPRAKSPSRAPGEDGAALVAAASSRLEDLGNYQVLLHRQERVGSALQPAEEVRLSIRRRPKAVRIEWPSGPHQGREVLYAADQNSGLMSVHMGDSLVPIPRMSMPPDSPLAPANSRHPITEAGFDTIVKNLETAMALSQKGDPAVGRFTYDGLEEVADVGHACHKFRQVKPNGETWLVYLDPQTKLPALVQADSPGGALEERYVFRELKTDLPDLATAAAFDPNRRWGAAPAGAGGLLHRLVRAGGAEAKADAGVSR